MPIEFTLDKKEYLKWTAAVKKQLLREGIERARIAEVFNRGWYQEMSNGLPTVEAVSQVRDSIVAGERRIADLIQHESCKLQSICNLFWIPSIKNIKNIDDKSQLLWLHKDSDTHGRQKRVVLQRSGGVFTFRANGIPENSPFKRETIDFIVRNNRVYFLFEEETKMAFSKITGIFNLWQDIARNPKEDDGVKICPLFCLYENAKRNVNNKRFCN